MVRTSKKPWWRLALALGLGLFCMGSSCLNPCQQLADKICSCESTEAEKQACRRQVQTQQNNYTLKNEQRLECQRMLTRCECRELKAGNLEICGLSRE